MSFTIGVSERNVSWLFNIFMDGCMREMKAQVGNVDARLKINVDGWAVVVFVCR